MPNPPNRGGRAHIHKTDPQRQTRKKGSPMYLVYAIAIALTAGLLGAAISGQVRKHMPRSGEIRER